jgi:3-oxoacyl-[acyl-carrier protein] reductase
MKNSNKQIDFSGKTFLVTGATRGIGKQIADDLADLGASLILTGTNEREIKQLNKQAIESKIDKAYYAVNFVKDDQFLAFEKELNKYSKVDGLVNNAAINRLNHIQDIDQNDWDDMVKVNLTTPVKLLNSISPKMIDQKYGRVVNIASIFGTISKEKRVAYSATKFGIHGLTVGASNDLAKHNILINTVSPGFVLTDLTKKNLSEKEIKDLKDQIPVKRLANTSDISSVVIFLLSDLNQYLTGQNIIVDGGFTNI